MIMEIVRCDGRGMLIAHILPFLAVASPVDSLSVAVLDVYSFQANNTTLSEHRCRRMRRSITARVNEYVMNSDFIAKQL